MNVKELERVSNFDDVLNVGELVQKEKIHKKLNIVRNFVKRFVDILVGLIGVVVLVPLTLIIYITRKILKEDDGPIFYEQLRIGKDGKLFKLYKYRTMVIGADERLKNYLKENEEAKKEYEKYKKLKNDPRITRLGNFLRRTSIDEMPQFINVLKGDMSLIGPRPYLLREKEDMAMYYEHIIKCKPGITGLWQVSGRNETTFEERLKIDMKYLHNSCLKNDVKIVAQTVKQVIKHKGAI